MGIAQAVANVGRKAIHVAEVIKAGVVPIYEPHDHGMICSIAFTCHLPVANLERYDFNIMLKLINKKNLS